MSTKNGKIPLPGQEPEFTAYLPQPSSSPTPKTTATQTPYNLLSVFAAISFILGALFLLTGFGLIGIIAAIILGHIAKHQIKRTHESGKIIATLTLVLSYITLTLTILFIGGILILANSIPPELIAN